MSVSIKSQSFYDKLRRLLRILPSTDFCALVIALGVVKGDESYQQKTSQFHLWLLSYEFSETIMVLSEKTCVFLTSKRKKVLLEGMVRPDDFDGPQVKVILREGGKDERSEEMFDELIKLAFAGKKVRGPVGTFTGE